MRLLGQVQFFVDFRASAPRNGHFRHVIVVEIVKVDNQSITPLQTTGLVTLGYSSRVIISDSNKWVYSSAQPDHLGKQPSQKQTPILHWETA
jgi:hypothetical protein